MLCEHCVVSETNLPSLNCIIKLTKTHFAVEISAHAVSVAILRFIIYTSFPYFYQQNGVQYSICDLSMMKSKEFQSFRRIWTKKIAENLVER